MSQSQGDQRTFSYNLAYLLGLRPKLVTIPTLVLAVIILADFAYPNATVNPTRPGGAVILGCEPQDIGVLRLAIENPRETQRQLLGAC